MSYLDMSFEKFLEILIICVISKTARPLRGYVKLSIFFIFLNIFLTVFVAFLLHSIINSLTDPNITIIEKVFSSLTFIGALGIFLKNLGAIPFHEDFVELVEWIEELYKEKNDNEIIQSIIDEELGKAKKYSLIFMGCYLSIYSIAAVVCFSTIIFNNFSMMTIPYLAQDYYSNIYNILAFILIWLCVFWTVSADCGNVFIALYVVGLMKIINRIIRSYSNNQECPNFLQKILQKHVEMLKAINAFNESFKFMSFIQIIMSTILFFTMLFSIQMYEKQFEIHITFAAAFLQLVFVCVFGEIIRSESEAIFDNLYQTNWYELSVKEQMVMMNSTNPISIKAGGMYDINLMTLVQILKLSLSYSAMILTFARE